MKDLIFSAFNLGELKYNMALIALALLFLSTFGWANSENTPQQKHIALKILQSSTLSVPNGLPLFVSGKSIVNILDLGKNIKVTGKKTGTAQIQIGQKIYNVHVLPDSLKDTPKDFFKALEYLPSIDLTVTEKEFVISGQLQKWDDWLWLSETLELKPYKMKALISDEIAAKAQSYIQSRIKNINQWSIVWQPFPKAQIAVDNKNENPTWKNLFLKLGIPFEIQPKTLADIPLIKLNLSFYEVQNAHQNQTGFMPPQSLQIALGPQISGETPVGELFLGESNGKQRLLHQTEWIGSVDTPMGFHSGGEIPIVNRSYRSSQVEWKKHGLQINTKVSADTGTQLKIDVDLELSYLDKANSIDGIPAIKNYHNNQVVIAKSGQSIKLSGMTRHHFGWSSQGVPGLQNTPVLGALLSSKSFLDNSSELMVIITATKVDSAQNPTPSPAALPSFSAPTPKDPYEPPH